MAWDRGSLVPSDRFCGLLVLPFLNLSKKTKLYFFFTLYCSFLLLDLLAFDAGESCYATLTSHVTTTQHCLAREFHCCCSCYCISQPRKYSPFSRHFPFKVLCKNHCEMSGSTMYIATYPYIIHILC